MTCGRSRSARRRAGARFTPQGEQPSVRRLAAAIYDPVRQRLIVSGGDSFDIESDAWALSLAGAGSWQRYSLGEIGKRSGHAAVYDPERDRMLVFGGGQGDVDNDLWAFRLEERVALELHPGVEPMLAPRGAAGALDAAGRRLVVFGGSNSGVATNDVWLTPIDGPLRWTRFKPIFEAPAPTRDAAATYDADRRQLIAWGGDAPGLGLQNDLWLLRLETPMGWTNLGNAGAPAARSGHSIVRDTGADRIVVFGGEDDAGFPLDDVHAWDAATETWSRIETQGSGPVGRAGHTAVYDPQGRRMIVFGGRQGFNVLDDAWALSLTEPYHWQRLSPDGDVPSGRFEHTAVYDATNGCMIVFGGYAEPGAWSLDLRGGLEWTRLATGGAESPGIEHIAVADPSASRMLVFGGLGAANYIGSLEWEGTLGVPSVSTVSRLQLGPPSPNPATGPVRIAYALDGDARATIELLDLQGRRVTSYEVVAPGGRSGTVTLDAPGLEPGIYVVRLRQAGRSVARAVTVLR